MVDEIGSIGGGKSVELPSKFDQERTDTHISSFFRYAFRENQLLDVEDRTARELINVLPLWKQETIEPLREVGTGGAFEHDLTLINSITPVVIIDSCERQLEPLLDRIQYEPDGRKKNSLAEKINILQSRSQVAKKALSIMQELPPFAK